ncbi:hypothetical protein AB0K15_13170 [Amycolatopsis sp. NPDC049253]|uniref:hypothetical protein n=1 Tax=Amycolatopsis sp. NPDC049253 TaxID=3155274 RepID=UPI00342489FA
MENVLRRLTSVRVAAAATAGGKRRPGGEPARQGLRTDDHRPFTPGGAQRLRAFLSPFGGNLAGADDAGTVHDMRFVFLENDTKMLFATAAGVRRASASLSARPPPATRTSRRMRRLQATAPRS